MSSIEIDEFVAGGLRGAKTWPVGTLVFIKTVINADGTEGIRPDGRKRIYAVPVGFAEFNGAMKSGETKVHTLYSQPGRDRRMIGRFVQPPNTKTATRGTHDVIHFTPTVKKDDNEAIAILAEPVTVHGPGDECREVVLTGRGSRKVMSCGPKHISAVVGGVTAFNWPASEFQQTVKYDDDMKDAYAGGPVYLKTTVL